MTIAETPISERQPFIPPPNSIGHSRRNVVGKATLRTVGVIFAILFGIISASILLFLLIYFVVVMPNRCFKLIDDPAASFVVGLDARRSRVFLVLSKPIATGFYESPMNVCGRSQSFDSTFLPALESFHLGSLSVMLTTEQCPEETINSFKQQQNGEEQENDRTVKFFIDGDVNETHFQSTRISVNISAETRNQNKKRVDQKVKLVHLQAANGTLVSPTPMSVKIDFMHESVLTFNPAIGVMLMGFKALLTSEVILLPEKSPCNFCGAPAIGITLDATFLEKFGQVLAYLLKNGLKQVSKIGLSQLLIPKFATISEVTTATQPLKLDFKMSKRDHQVANPSQSSSVFNLKESSFRIEQTRFSVTNLTLSNFSRNGDDLRLRCLINLATNITEARVTGTAKLRKPTAIDVHFRDASFNCPLDVDLFPVKPVMDEKIVKESGRHSKIGQEIGHFSMKNVSAFSYADNSSITAAALIGSLETVLIRSSRSFISELLVNYDFLFDFTILEVRSAKMADPIKINFGTGVSQSPFTFQLYRIGKVGNSMKVGFSFPRALLGTPPPIVAAPNALSQVSSPARRSSSELLLSKAPSIQVPIAPPLSFDLQLWAIDIVDVRAAAFLPMKSNFKLDSLSFRFDSSQPNDTSVDEI